MDKDRIPTHMLKRELPSWVKVVKTINNVDIYNMSILDKINDKLLKNYVKH